MDISRQPSRHQLITHQHRPSTPRRRCNKSSSPNRNRDKVSIPMIQPFEWLTSPDSLATLIKEHVFFEVNKKNDNQGDSSSSAPAHNFRQALHVGCGSSTAGEFLVQSMGFSKVVNVDRDYEAMKLMQERWLAIAADDVDKDGATTSQSLVSKIEFRIMDFTKESLPSNYINSFDLVLDKSTLDCTLCSDTATAALLVQVYQTLKVNGGVYLVISFHDVDLLLPLLRDLPGAQWTVEHTTMDRQVEQLSVTEKCVSTQLQRQGASSVVDTTTSSPSSPSHHYPKPLNVMIARRSFQQNEINDDVVHRDNVIANSTLEFEAVYEHVHRVNDQWFRVQQPLLTPKRIQELKEAFRGGARNDDDDDDDDDERNVDINPTKSQDIPLEKAFCILFTDAERELLTFDHFLEDWEAFVEKKGLSGNTYANEHRTRTMTYETAVDFLTEMQ
jgi:hypothetical protein